MRYGWSVIWKSKNGSRHYEYESRGEADRKAAELKTKGYYGIKIVQCIF